MRWTGEIEKPKIDYISFAVYYSNMSRAEIISEIPMLSHEARREIMRCIIEAEEEAVTLAECDQRALERFQMLDRMEAEDEKNAAR
jgi:hypothetical protein